MNKIPKIIHYCWFGHHAKPENIQKCMNTWKKMMPDYKIMEWNEDNFDIQNSVVYVREAYKVKKYAFVSDYVRLWALKEYGGIYLDTDVEILQSPERLLQDSSLVTGFETLTTLITAFIACEKDNFIINEFLDRYRTRSFVRNDGSYDLTPINDKFTELLCEHGLKLDNCEQILENKIKIYPYVVFCGYDIENSHPKITDMTYTVHHFQGSWKEKSLNVRIKYQVVVPIIQKIIGYDKYDKLKAKLKNKK